MSNMNGLEVLYQHECPKPVITSSEKNHRWTCECGARWIWTPNWLRLTEIKHYGFLWLRTKRVPVEPQNEGYWFCEDRPEVWVPVQEGDHV